MITTANLVAAQPTAQQLADYANALITVNSYAYAITNQQLPILNQPPPDYGSFSASFAPARAHALDWSNNIFVSMVQLPNTIVSQASNLFNMEETYINAYLNMLIQDPSNSQAKSGLASSLQTLSQLIQTQVAAINTIQTQLTAFNTNILNDAQTLTQIAAKALADVGTDQANIQKLNADIQSLNSKISTAQTLLTVSELGLGLSIFVALIGVVCCLIPGAEGVGAGLIVIGVAGEAASIAGTVIENKSITAMQNEISADKSTISDLNQDIIMLQAVSTQFNNLYQSNLQAQAALTTIEQMWTSLDSTINAVATDLTDINNDVTAAQYRQALTDFTDAESNWNDVVAFAKALAGINYSWQDASGTWHNYGTSNPTLNGSQVNQIPQAA